MNDSPKKTMLFVTLADISAYGVRCLCAYLQSRGRVADTVSLRLSDNRRSLLGRRPSGEVPEAMFENFLAFAQRYDCIGVSLFSDGLGESARITEEVKKRYPDKTVIWGSIHPTLKPGECLAHADYVCVGEGYYSVEQLLERLDANEEVGPRDLPEGIWCRDGDGSAHQNGCSRLCLDLDTLPHPDYSRETSYVRNDDNTISSLDRRGYRRYLDYAYYTMFSQGCPNSCSYCCNYALKKLNKGYAKIRKHSVSYIIDEINGARRHYTFYNVFFMDDSFILMDDEVFDEFVERYPKEVGLPFIVTGFIPRYTQSSHVDRLVEAGMIRGRIGVQTGSSKMLGVYNRKQPNEEIVRVSEFFSKHRKKIVPTGYDIILDGYNETIEDKIETAVLISKIKGPFILNLASLKAYPGTAIADRMDNYRPGDSYVRVADTVINSVIGLQSIVRIPDPILGWVLRRKGLLQKSVPGVLTALIYYAILARKMIYHLRHGEYSSKPCWVVDVVRRLRGRRCAA
ncbi:B12-binding domain-containing radical SAM protein [Candidatus Latescibacterota bacterium]